MRENDGAIKVSISRSDKLGMSDKSHSDTHVILSNNVGDELKLLDITVDQLSMPRYFPDRKVYFGSSFFDNCGKLWWLYVDSWKVRTQKKCLGRWAATNSVIALPTRAGLFIEHHTGSQKFKTHLVTDNKEYALETVSARRAVLAPGGCRVAYGSGEIGFGKNRLSQVLKVFDSCQFMEDQGE